MQSPAITCSQEATAGSVGLFIAVNVVLVIRGTGCMCVHAIYNYIHNIVGLAKLPVDQPV